MWTASVMREALRHLPPLEDPPGLHRDLISSSFAICPR